MKRPLTAKLLLPSAVHWGIEGSEMQNWLGRRRVVGRLFPMPKWCEGPQVARSHPKRHLGAMI